ncbi:hypothetical protein L6452_35089 [Arctium lappa]|uniref:Uncharacterized protein n=1 Tax=Arctium lappa TaxID=4217 RepID=A0ACB8YJ73_ARCLA|nr:hypothetical protein L6452_35089 [Arctium lappa]
MSSDRRSKQKAKKAPTMPEDTDLIPGFRRAKIAKETTDVLSVKDNTKTAPMNTPKSTPEVISKKQKVNKKKKEAKVSSQTQASSKDSTPSQQMEENPPNRPKNHRT